MDYKIIKSILELSKYKDIYDDFLIRNINNEYYYYLYENIKSLQAFLEKNTKIVFILVFEKDLLIAVAPFQIKTRHPLYLSSNQLQFIGSQSHLLGSNYGNIIRDASYRIEDIDKTILSALKSKEMVSWDEFEFTNLKQTTTTPFPSDINFQVKKTSSCYRTPTTQDVISYISSIMKKKSRQKLTRYKKNIIKDYPDVEFKTLNVIDNEVFTEISKIHSQRQKQKRENSDYKGFESLFDNGIESDSLMKLSKWLSTENMLRIYTLNVKNKIIAFLYCIHMNNLSNAVIMAFDNTYSKYSPSKILALYAFDQQYNEKNAVEMDFLADSNLFKQQLCPIEIERITAIAPNPFKWSSKVKWLYIRFLKSIISRIGRS